MNVKLVRAGGAQKRGEKMGGKGILKIINKCESQLKIWSDNNKQIFLYRWHCLFCIGSRVNNLPIYNYGILS